MILDSTFGTDRFSEGDHEHIKKFKQFLYEDPIKGEDEPLVIEANEYAKQANEMEDELTMTLEARRKKVLPAALETFNKVQGKSLDLSKKFDLSAKHDSVEIPSFNDSP